MKRILSLLLVVCFCAIPVKAMAADDAADISPEAYLRQVRQHAVNALSAVRDLCQNPSFDEGMVRDTIRNAIGVPEAEVYVYDVQAMSMSCVMPGVHDTLIEMYTRRFGLGGSTMDDGQYVRGLMDLIRFIEYFPNVTGNPERVKADLKAEILYYSQEGDIFMQNVPLPNTWPGFSLNPPPKDRFGQGWIDVPGDSWWAVSYIQWLRCDGECLKSNPAPGEVQKDLLKFWSIGIVFTSYSYYTPKSLPNPQNKLCCTEEEASWWIL